MGAKALSSQARRASKSMAKPLSPQAATQRSSERREIGLMEFA